MLRFIDGAFFYSSLTVAADVKFPKGPIENRQLQTKKSHCHNS